MSGLLVLALIAAAVWAWHRYGQSGGTGAGASAAARARELRTLRVRLAAALGIQTDAGKQAARWAAGAEGERRVADRLAPLIRDKWTLRFDRALPTGRANVDCLAISPTGRVFLPDAKRWSRHYPVTVSGGRLFHGDRDVTGRLDGLRHEARAVAGVLGVPVTPIAVMDGAPLVGANGQAVRELTVDGVRIVPADRIADVLRVSGALPGQRTAAHLTKTADRALKPYTSR
ncbi:nuclease-related domain-containing protein [Streptomyces sp. NRRL S-350]|uniref:nuclease-related domain-containing protein n=1 Tax=Streptomyces sp. NRRL S-350 TaxID=1463902 RepID=UPI0004C0A97B|nr:nuclease-related domain-containing protein [Streptomyces sp. NRRL S-350]